VNELKPACHIALFLIPEDFGPAENLAANLTEKEARRLAKYQQPERRQQYIVGRLLLKDLARTLFGIHQPEIRNHLSGAPYLSHDHSNYSCSLSHSGPYLLAGIQSHGPLGIDIEQYQPRQMARLVDHYFHPEEQARFHQLPEPLQADYFFQLWTCKEALAKQSGDGIKLAKLREAVSEQAGQIYLLQGIDYCGAISSELHPDLWQAVWQGRGFAFLPLPEPKPLRF